MTTNVYAVRNVKTGKIEYFVGIYDNGRYVRSHTAAERRASGCNATFGNLSYVGTTHKSRSGAIRSAESRWGYAQVENARYVLGDKYESL